MFFEWIELLKISKKVNQTSKQYKFKRIPRTLWNAKLLDRYFDWFSVTEFFNLFPIDFVLNLHIIFRARSPHLNFRVNVIPSNINFNPFNNWSGCAEYFPMRVNGEIKFEDWCGCSSLGNGEKYHWNHSASCNIWSIFSDSWIRGAHRVKLSMMMMKMMVMTLAMMMLILIMMMMMMLVMMISGSGVHGVWNCQLMDGEDGTGSKTGSTHSKLQNIYHLDHISNKAWCINIMRKYLKRNENNTWHVKIIKF